MFLDPKNAKVFGPEFIKAIAAQKPTPYRDSVVTLDRVIAGEHDFTYWSAEAHVSLKWEQGAPVRWVHPDPTPIWGNTLDGVSKYTPHPNVARLFLNWLTSDGGALSHQHIGYQTSLKGVKDIRKFTSEPWYDPIKTNYDVLFLMLFGTNYASGIIFLFYLTLGDLKIESLRRPFPR